MYPWRSWAVAALAVAWGTGGNLGWGQQAVALPEGVRAVWDLEAAHRETTDTRERVCINGLWKWQPADPQTDRVPEENWGYFKVPGAWPEITTYMQKDSQTVHAHPQWQETRLSDVAAAWYQREITVPDNWTGRRIAVSADYLNSYAEVYVDGRRGGEMRFPAGEVEIGDLCQPGGQHTLSLLVVALPLQGVRMSYNDSNAAREVPGSVARRGLCGDVYLTSTPSAARVGDIRLDTSVRQQRMTVDVELLDLSPNTTYSLHVRVKDGQRVVKTFASGSFDSSSLESGSIRVSDAWLPDKLWDTHTPEHQYEMTVSLLDDDGTPVDIAPPIRFGFREFWIDGRDFYLNGNRIFLSVVPLDNAQVGAALAVYEAARESLLRLQSFGINFVYTHNYDCQPGSHLSFAEILRAADDVGMLVALSQPHFSDYDWQSPDAEHTNGYAGHAAFYVRVAQHHPSVVMYATSHNATGYSEDMNPDLIDGIYDQRSSWAMNNVRRALRAKAVVRSLDPSRIVYHHSSGNLSSMHTSNFYPNFVPVQEMSDWFEHWATVGVKPFFACEYGAPFTWDWAMYRGWFQDTREFGSAAVPWDFCLAEWNSQFLGDRAFQISEQERRNLRWEAERFRSGRLWHRWDYPHRLGSTDFDERYPVLANYLQQNWRAFRTWGVSAISPWEHHVFWKLRPGMDRNRREELSTDWQQLQRPGFSPDFLHQRYERMDLAYQRSDWVATPAAEAMYRNNRPLLAYLAGKPDRFTSQDHNFLPGETVEKQIVLINNSRVAVTCQYEWVFTRKSDSVVLAASASPAGVRVETGQQKRIPLRLELPADASAGEYLLSMTARMQPADEGDGQASETQQDRFVVHVLASTETATAARSTRDSARVALFDPVGETGGLLAALGVSHQTVQADADLDGYDLLVIGRMALSAEGSAPDLARVRDGLKVLVFEQTAEALERRLGFRVIEYGLRNVFPRVPDHPLLAGLTEQHLRDWRGEATLLPSRLDYQASQRYSGAPAVRWCGLEVPRLWRCGNQGNVASVSIEKPARGDFLPIVDGGFSLQYSPLLEYREGTGMVLFCQLDVTDRTESAGPRGDQVVRGEDMLVQTETWQELHVTFQVDKPSAEGWHAYLHCGQEGATFRADLFRLYEGPYSPERRGAGDEKGQGIRNMLVNSSFESGMDPWDFTWPTEQQNLRRTYRRWSFLVNRLLANMGVAADTPLLSRFAKPSSGATGESLLRNGDFQQSRGDDELEHWQIVSDSRQVAWEREPGDADFRAQILKITSREPVPESAGRQRGSVMLAQHDVPVQADQWYRIRLRAKAEGLTADGVTLAVQDTQSWRSLIDYQRFVPQATWEEFTFLVQAKATAESQTRFQIWHDSTGTLWLAEVSMTPCDPPTQGRWTRGLYADQPQEWDDPYRFFRW